MIKRLSAKKGDYEIYIFYGIIQRKKVEAQVFFGVGPNPLQWLG